MILNSFSDNKKNRNLNYSVEMELPDYTGVNLITRIKTLMFRKQCFLLKIIKKYIL